jgi:hypothetical protein
VIFFEITGMHEANTRDSGVHYNVNHACALITTYGDVLPHCKLSRIMKKPFAFAGDFQVSLITVCLKHIIFFLQKLLTCNHNFAKSSRTNLQHHRVICLHTQSLWIHCKIWTEVANRRSQITQKENGPVEPRVTTLSFDLSTQTTSSGASLFGDVLWLWRNLLPDYVVNVIEGLFFRTGEHARGYT